MKNAQHELIAMGPSAESMTARLQTILQVIAMRYPCIHRLALAIYDAPTDMLKTFVSSSMDGEALLGHEARLHEVPSLLALAESRQSRLVSNIADTFAAETVHTKWLKARGYSSSYTVPVYHGADFAGFMFFDSKGEGAFDRESAAFLDVFADLMAQLYLLQRSAVRSLIGAVRVASDLARARDLETGNHLVRMANYSRLIARALAPRYGFCDEYIEYVHLFAPLHDIGKVGIPDCVLLKPGRLNDAEWQVMRRHVEIGETLIDQLVRDMGLIEDVATQVMRNIVAGHHERGDGSGYPRGLRLAEIPWEARIVAVADVYDALSNRRPYKQAWSEDEVVAEMRREVACGHLDPDCTAALLAAREAREAIQRQFAD